MEVAFAKNPAEVVKETQVVDTPVPGVTVEIENTYYGVPAVPTSNTAVGPLLGDKIPTFGDIKMARCNLAQNIGPLGEAFEPGSLVFDQRVILFSPQKVEGKTGVVIRPASKPIILCVLGFKPTRFAEKTAGGVPGMIVDTEDEVRNQGGTLDYKEFKLKEKDGMKRFEQLADALVAIQRPEDGAVREDDPDFGFVVDGKHYALALWALRGTVYTAAAKGVFFRDRLMGCLRLTGYPGWHYAVSTFEKLFGVGHKSWVPICIPIQKSSDKFMAFASDVLNPKAS